MQLIGKKELLLLKKLASLPPKVLVFIYSIYHWPFPIKIEMLRNYIRFTDLLIHVNIEFGFTII